EAAMRRVPSKQAQSIIHAAQDEVLREQSEQTMLYMSAASLKASYEAAQMEGKQLLERDKAQALECHNRNADRTHGWSGARQQSQVQVAVQVNMPTPEEQAQREADHKRMDELTAQLQRRLTPGGGGQAPAPRKGGASRPRRCVCSRVPREIAGHVQRR